MFILAHDFRSFSRSALATLLLSLFIIGEARGTGGCSSHGDQEAKRAQGGGQHSCDLPSIKLHDL